MASDLLDSNDGSGFRKGHGRRLDLNSGSHERLGSSGLVVDDGYLESGESDDGGRDDVTRDLRPRGSKGD